MPAKLNTGWIYKEKVMPENNGMKLLDILSYKYTHSSHKQWAERVISGTIRVNGSLAKTWGIVNTGDIISWERPPWEEAAIPCYWDVLFDNGDVMVINKPSGLPVMPGGGFLRHTLTELLYVQAKEIGESLPAKPVHRLGRFTSGILVCARKKESLARLSCLFRNQSAGKINFSKVYRALTIPNSNLPPKGSLEIRVPIKKFPHPIMGYIWNSAVKNKGNLQGPDYAELEAFSKIKLLEKQEGADLLEVVIGTGRPHQIRIHLAYLGTPLIGDPLYLTGGKVSDLATPGEGGYLLHAHKLEKIVIEERIHTFEALLPWRLQSKEEQKT